MISRLSIKNYAIIDSLSLEFENGLTVLTGETGAGKSIIIGAINLLLGEKCDSSVIRSGEERATIEAEFTLQNPHSLQRLKELQIDSPQSLIIRREIVKDGKNRAFINGYQEPISKLAEIGEWLIDLHGQHDHQLLLNQKVHLDILDEYGRLGEERARIAQIFNTLSQKLDYQKELSQDEAKLLEEKSFWETAVSDIQSAKLSPEEENELTEDLKKMENAEKIASSFHTAHETLYDADDSVVSKMNIALSSVREVSAIDKRYEELAGFLEDAMAKIDESVNCLTDYREELEFDPKIMEETIDRLEFIKDLKRKYKKNTINELLEYAKDSSEKLRLFENRGAELSKLSQEIEAIKASLIESCLALSQRRQTVAKDLSEKIKGELSYLGMEQAAFVVDIKYVRAEEDLFVINNIPVKINQTGMDRVEFFISSNVGEEPRPLRKVASGGEISRVMLALKSILAHSDTIDTLIFDEIDVGIGGITANHVGEKMKSISQNKQLFVITHLAQIASKAAQHLLVKKEARDNKTYTSVAELNQEERITEIARMLGGESNAALSHAREMLSDGDTLF